MKIKKLISLILITSIMTVTAGCAKEETQLSEMEVYPDPEETEIDRIPARGEWTQQAETPYTIAERVAGDDIKEYEIKWESVNGIPVTEEINILHCVQLPDLTTFDYSYTDTDAPVITGETTRIQALLAQDANILTDPEATAQMGDKVYIAIETRETESGFQFLNYTHDKLFVPLGSTTLPQEVERGIVGMKVGEQKPLEITFPQDSDARDFAGLSVRFDIVMLTIARPEEPSAAAIAQQQRLNDKIQSQGTNHRRYAEIRRRLIERSTVIAYPTVVINELRNEYERGYTQSGNLKDIVDMTGTTIGEFMVGENEYITANIDSRVVLWALRVVTGINEESEIYRNNLITRGKDYADPDGLMYETIIDQLEAAYGAGDDEEQEEGE